MCCLAWRHSFRLCGCGSFWRWKLSHIDLSHLRVGSATSCLLSATIRYLDRCRPPKCFVCVSRRASSPFFVTIHGWQHNYSKHTAWWKQLKRQQPLSNTSNSSLIPLQLAVLAERSYWMCLSNIWKVWNLWNAQKAKEILTWYAINLKEILSIYNVIQVTESEREKAKQHFYARSHWTIMLEIYCIWLILIYWCFLTLQHVG